MALFALTQNNINFIKRSLKPSYSSVKSSHLSEAIAVACGFRTNIALVASLRVADPRRPDLAKINNEKFTARLVELGYSAVDATAITIVVQSQQMPERIWLVRKGKNISPLNDWFRECQQRDIPYVYITNRRTLAQIDWDCIALDTKHDEVTSREGSELVSKMFKTFQSIAKPRSGNPIFDGSSFVGDVDKVPIEWAPDLADAIFRILYEAIREGERHAVA